MNTGASAVSSRSRWLMLANHVPATGAGGGIVRWTTEFIAALTERAEMYGDLDVHVASTREAKSFFIDGLGMPETNLHDLAGGPRGELAVRRGWGIAGGRSFDVVMGFKHLVPASNGALRILVVHDMTLFDRPADFGVLKRKLLPAPYRGSIGDAELLACVSDATRARLNELMPRTASRSFTARTGVARSLLNTEAAPLASLAGKRFALAVGDRSPRKNLGLIVDLWPEVRRAVPDAVLVLAGPKNWGRDTLGESVQRLAEEGSVVFAGQVSDGELRWAYQECVALLFPSFTEGFGLPVSEACAFGANVIRSLDAAAAEAAQGRGVAVDVRDRRGWLDAIVDTFVHPRRLTPLVADWSRAVDDVVRQVHPSPRRTMQMIPSERLLS